MLSVVLTNYNHASYLPFALEGLLAQTRPADEIIVLDDSSTDNSIEVIRPFLSRHPDIRLERNPGNRGTMYTVNRGLQMARGDLIYFAAADDVTYPELLAKGDALLGAYPDACLFTSRTEIIDAEGHSQGILATPMPLSSPGYLDPAAVARHLLRDDSWFSGASAIWRRQHLLDIGGFPEALASYSDGYVSRLLALKHGCCFTPEVLCTWRRMAGGMAWSAATQIDKARETIAVIKGMMDAPGAPFPPGYADRWDRRQIFGLRRFALVQNRRTARQSSSGRWLAAIAREAILTPWLFLSLRPFDIAPVFERRLRALFSAERST